MVKSTCSCSFRGASTHAFFEFVRWLVWRIEPGQLRATGSLRHPSCANETGRASQKKRGTTTNVATKTTPSSFMFAVQTVSCSPPRPYVAEEAQHHVRGIARETRSTRYLTGHADKKEHSTLATKLVILAMQLKEFLGGRTLIGNKRWTHATAKHGLSTLPSESDPLHRRCMSLSHCCCVGAENTHKKKRGVFCVNCIVAAQKKCKAYHACLECGEQVVAPPDLSSSETARHGSTRYFSLPLLDSVGPGVNAWRIPVKNASNLYVNSHPQNRLRSAERKERRRRNLRQLVCIRELERDRGSLLRCAHVLIMKN